MVGLSSGDGGEGGTSQNIGCLKSLYLQINSLLSPESGLYLKLLNFHCDWLSPLPPSSSLSFPPEKLILLLSSSLSTLFLLNLSSSS